MQSECVCVAVFLTDLGWFGLVGQGETVVALTIGHASAEAVRGALAAFAPPTFPGSAWERPPATLRVASSDGNPASNPARSGSRKRKSRPQTESAPEADRRRELELRDWNPALLRRLEAFARGEPCEFADCDVALPELTLFQRRVIAETRRIRWGQTLSYGELAERAGAPRAARAVGSVMAANRVPIIIPCHRIVASGGLGGYSAPQGLDLKRRLLALEAPAR